MKFYVYRTGSNSANQSMENGPVQVATVEANSANHARELVAQRVTVYNNQYLTTELAETVDASEEDIDNRVELSDDIID